jgi:hypothetical protein
MGEIMDSVGGAPAGTAQSVSGAAVQKPPDERLGTEIVYNDRMSFYMPKSENIVEDEKSGIKYVNNEMMVMFTAETTTPQALALIEANGGESKGYLAAINRYEVVFPGTYTLDELETAQAKIEAEPLVEIAYTNIVSALSPQYTPNDAHWDGKWNGEKTVDGNWGMEAIHAQKLWDYKDEMGQVRVGVFDVGFYDHEDLKINVLSPNVADDHGTHVAGTIGAGFENDAIGVVGVLPGNTKLFGVSCNGFVDSNNFSKYELEKIWNNKDPKYSRGTPASIQELALIYLIAERKCKVVNMSLSYNSWIDPYPYSASRGNESAINYFRRSADPTRRVMARLLAMGNDFLYVAAAGNDNKNYYWWNAKDSLFPLFVKDESLELEYRYTKNSYEASIAHRGNADTSYSSPICFIGSKQDTKVYDKNTKQWRDYNATESAIVKSVREHIIVVGAAELKEGGKLHMADFSNHGTNVDIAAPGVGIESTTIGSSYDEKEGTSMASPHVAGAAAAIWSMDWTQNSKSVKDTLISSASMNLSYVWHNVTAPNSDEVSQIRELEEYPFLDVGAAAEKVAREKERRAEENESQEPDEPIVPVTDDIIDTYTSFVFDVSTSMDDSSGRQRTFINPDSGTEESMNISKLEAAKDAATAVMKTVRLSASRSEGDINVGIATFSDDMAEITSPIANYDAVETAISNLETVSGTNMLAGIEVGVQQLSGKTGNRTMIYLSDGQDTDGNTDEVILEAAREAKEQDIKIFTIGFGTEGDINEELLKQIASETGGTYSFASASDSVEIAASFISAQLKSTSSVLGEDVSSIGAGETSEPMQLAVPPDSGDLSTVLYWSDTNSAMNSETEQIVVPSESGQLSTSIYAQGVKLDTVLTDPEGTKVDANYPGVTIDDTQIPAQIVVTDPKEGAWSLSVAGSKTAPVRVAPQISGSALTPAAASVSGVTGSAYPGNENTGATDAAIVSEVPYYAVAAFKSIEREYPMNQVASFNDLSVAGEAEKTVIAPAFVFVMAAGALPVGAFLIVLTLSLLYIERKRRRIETDIATKD